MPISIPDSFVRFYGNPEFALDCIENRQLTLIHTSKFNDPFDPVLNFILECNWDHDAFIKWVENNKGKLNEEDIEPHRIGWNSARAKLESFFNHVRNTMFMACFSTTYTKDNGEKIYPQHNLYMWGHYGKGHRGIAIEFKKEIFISSTGEICINHVEYRDELPTITNEELYEFVFNKNISIINAKEAQILRTKTKNWEPEQEWRFSRMNDTTKLPWIKIPLPEDSIRAIYLGCQIDAGICEKIITQAKNIHPKTIVYKARQDTKKLKLLFDVI